MPTPRTPHPDWNPERQSWVYPLRTTTTPAWPDQKRRALVAYIAVELIEEDTDQAETSEADQ